MGPLAQWPTGPVLARPAWAQALVGGAKGQGIRAMVGKGARASPSNIQAKGPAQPDKIKYTLFQGLGGGGGGGWGVSFLILQILGGFIRGSDGFGRSGHQSA